ncbi:50S ribosomal protein L2 [archaeon]|nr:50S ribosomal protein L2 [archaeon]
MGKNLRQQRRGRGTPRYRSPGHRYLGNISYANMAATEGGKIVDIVHAPGRHLPVAIVEFNGRKSFMIAAEGANTGKIMANSLDAGNIMKLKDIPEGSKIHNIELRPGDGGRLCRTSGTFAVMTGREGSKCTILMPSKEKKIFPSECLATIGTAAAGGRGEKPFRKAGTKHHAMKSFNRPYPHVCGVSMNACNHPFGGQTRPGKVKTVSRHMPPGRKVGSISPRRTGRRKV